MKLLVVTNLYPPQELGGYGRCIADFVWGLKHLGHYVHVLCSDANYLGSSNFHGPSSELVSRSLQLKGSFQNGLCQYQDSEICRSIDEINNAIILSFTETNWDGIIVGNMDLLGSELFQALLSFNCKVLHHIGFVSPPYPSHLYPNHPDYLILPASKAVRCALLDSDFPVHGSPIVFPGVRLELIASSQDLLSPTLEYSKICQMSGFPLATPANPLKIGFAGLLMASKGAHTLVQSLIQLNNMGYSVQANIAGAGFQSGYRQKLEYLLNKANMLDVVRFVGNLERHQLKRFWALHHIGVFPSMAPEAFGISAAEIMASGVALLSTGVGGSSELFEDTVSGLRFLPDNCDSLTSAIVSLINNPSLLFSIAKLGKERAFRELSVENSVLILDKLFRESSFSITV